jgi:hypothetical protein
MLRIFARTLWGVLIVSLSLAVGCGGGSAGVAPAGDGGGGFDPAIDPNDCTGAPTILASSYDQSCSTAADCTMVAEGQFCAKECPPCPYSVISAGALAKYWDDVTAASKGEQSTAACGACAPAPFAACCLAGKCHADSQCPSPAAADAASSPDGASSSDAALE